MNWKTTLVLLVLVGGLGAWVYWGESNTTATKDLQPKRVLPKFKVDDATKVVIQRGKGLSTGGDRGGGAPPEEIVIAKDGAVWRMEKPIADKADEGKVRELLAPLEFLDASSMREGDEAKAVPFGDVEERLAISRPQDKGGDVVIELGAAGVGGDRNLRVAGRNAVFVVKKDLFERIAWDLFLFRAKEIFTIPTQDAGKISAKLPSGAQGPSAAPRLLELVKGKDHSWRVGGSDGELAETKRVTELLDKLKDLKAMGAATDAPTEQELASFEISTPAYEVTLVDSGDKTTKSETLTLGKKVDATKNEERYARITGRSTVYRVDPTDLLKELLRDPLSFRSDALVPLSAGIEGLTSLSAKTKSREWKLVKKENEWSFEKPAAAKADADAVKALLKAATDPKIATREPGNDFGKAGLADPVFTIAITEGDVPRSFSAGTSTGGGNFFVRRGDEARIFTAKLGDLEQRLDAAPLALRSKAIFKASSWDMTEWKLTAPDGKEESAAEKKGNDWVVKGYKPEDLDPAKITHAFEPLGGVDGIKADSLVAEVTSESLVQYGLDKPRVLAVTLESWEAGSNQKKKEEKSLLLGRREGDSIYACEKGATAIGKIKAEFLDLIERGFRKGKDLWSFTSFDCVAFVVSEGPREVLRLEKKKDPVTNADEWWMGSKKVVGQEVTERILRGFEKVEGFSQEEATDANKKARGLAPPWRTITVQTKPTWGEHKDEIVTKTYLLGGRAGDHDIYAMEQGGTETAQIFDGPVHKLEAFVASPPYLEEKKDGTAPVGSPSTPNR